MDLGLVDCISFYSPSLIEQLTMSSLSPPNCCNRVVKGPSGREFQGLHPVTVKTVIYFQGGMMCDLDGTWTVHLPRHLERVCIEVHLKELYNSGLYRLFPRRRTEQNQLLLADQLVKCATGPTSLCHTKDGDSCCRWICLFS